MALKVTKVDVWAGEMQDKPGELGRMLGALAGAGASIDCVIGRRQPDKPGTGVVFVSPVKGKKAQAAAKAAGMAQASHVNTLRVEGSDKPGLGAKLASAIGDAGVNLRGVSAAVLGGKFVAYLGFDSPEAASRAVKALKAVK